MALSPFQIEVCRVLADARPATGAYLAGGSALNALTDAPRQSRDLDIFHDTLEALEATFESDSQTLRAQGYQVEIVRQLSGFIEVIATREGQSVEIQWLRDSAFRFFPLQQHPLLGFVLHPFDLATNKILALVGRTEARDWVDALSCHDAIAPLGLLAFAACGKDEGWNPELILDEATRTAHYSRVEIEALDWSGPMPDFAALKTQWRAALQNGRELIEILPPQNVGNAVLNRNGTPFQDDVAALKSALEKENLRFHAGQIGGIWPTVSELPR